MIKNLNLGRKSNRTTLLRAIFLGLLSAILIYVYLNANKSDDGGQVGPTQSVVVAGQDVPAGSRITADMLTVKSVPNSLVLAEAFTTTEDVVGDVTMVSLVAGEQIVSGRLSSSSVDIAEFDGEVPLSVVIPQGMRGFSIRASEVAAAGGLVRPGDYVDVVMSTEVAVGEVQPGG